MKLRIRHANITKLLTLQEERNYSIGDLKSEIRSTLAESLGLAASINFNLSLNGSTSLGSDALDISQAGVVGGDLLKIISLEESSLDPSAGASQSTSRDRHVAESEKAGPSQREDQPADSDSRLKSLFESDAVKSPFHAMCVWIHNLMLKTFKCQPGFESDVSSVLHSPVLHMEYQLNGIPSTKFALTITQLGPFVLINGIVRPCRNIEPQVISLQVKLSDFVSFETKPAYSVSVYMNRERMKSLIQTEIISKAVDGMRAEARLPQLRGLVALPHEMLIKVFAYLEAPALCAIAQTCKPLQRVSGDDSLWEVLFNRSFNPSPNPNDIAWKEMFKREYMRRQREDRERREYVRDFAVIPPNPFAPTPDVPIIMPYPGQPLGMLGGDYDLDPGFPYGPLARPPRRQPFNPLRPSPPGNPFPGSRYDPMYPGGSRFRPGRGGGMMDDGMGPGAI